MHIKRLWVLYSGASLSSMHRIYVTKKVIGETVPLDLTMKAGDITCLTNYHKVLVLAQDEK